MAELKDLEPKAQRFIERYPFPKMDAPHITPLKKPLSQAKIALITTAGLHLESDKPFSKVFMVSDCSYRKLPIDSPRDKFKISHTSNEFNRDGVKQDLNVVLPIDRVNELIDENALGSLAKNCYSFMGSLPKTGKLRKETAPALAKELKADAVDIALLTPV